MYKIVNSFPDAGKEFDVLTMFSVWELAYFTEVKEANATARNGNKTNYANVFGIFAIKGRGADHERE